MKKTLVVVISFIILFLFSSCTLDNMDDVEDRLIENIKDFS